MAKRYNAVEFPVFHSAQRKLYDERVELDVWRCGRRFGKALSLDTRLPTPTGWTTMGDVQIGDWLFSDDGTPCQVTSMTGVMYNRPCNIVRFSDNTEIIADDDHLWLTWDRCARKNVRRNGRKVHKMANPKKPINQSSKIRTTAEIRSTISSGIRGDRNHSIQPCSPVICEEKELTIPPYVLGAWLGDGLSAGARLACDDRQIIDEIISEGQICRKAPQKFMYSLSEISQKGVSQKDTLRHKLRKLGLLNNKHVPAAYMRASVSQRLALLQGLMDTDGTVSTLGHCDFTTTSKPLSDAVLELTRSLGIRSVMSEGRAKLYGKDCGPKYRICFTTALPVFRLKRKLDRLNARVSDRNVEHRFIVSVTPCESVPVKCIQVDSKDRLYLCSEAFIPTHNTTTFEILAGDEAIKGKKIGWFSPNYKLLLPSYKRILKMIKPLVDHASKVDSLIELKSGGEIEFWTLNDEDAGRSRFYDLALIDEASLVKKGLRDTWEQSIAPTLLDRGGKAIMAGTPKGIDPDNFFYEACTNKALGWHEQHMPTHANPKLDPARLAELPNKYPPLVFQQEYKADFVDWSGAAFFSLHALLENDQAVPYPEKCDAVFAIIDTAIKTGRENDGTGVIYFAMNKYHGHPLIVLDWDIVQIEGASLEGWLPSVFRRLEEFAQITNARNGSIGAHIEDKASGQILLQQARNRGWPAFPIESGLTAVGKDERALNVSGYVHTGKVKLSQFAFDKNVEYKGQSRNHFITQVCGFRIGVKDQADDLLDCFTYGAAIALGNPDGY